MNFRKLAKKEADELRGAAQPTTSLFGVRAKVTDQMSQLMERPPSYREVVLRQIHVTNLEALRLWEKWEKLMERYRLMIPTSKDATALEKRMDELIRQTRELNKEIDEMISRLSR